jgi:molybdopterin-guanine dinucleotide biosynthesis protein A
MAGLRVIAAVLAGGRGTRLGGRKPETFLGGEPLIARALRAPELAGLETIVVAKAATELPQLRHEVVREPDGPGHPLCGALAALEHVRAGPARADAVLLLACDMPFLAPSLLMALASLEGAALTRAGERAEPLPARVPLEAAAALRAALELRSPLRAALEQLSPRYIERGELARFGDPARMLFNVNDRADLTVAGELLDRAPG